MSYSEEQLNRIRDNAIELYELLNEFFERYTRYHIVTMDRDFIERVLTAIHKCKGGQRNENDSPASQGRQRL